MAHARPPLAQRRHPCLRTAGLDVRARQVVLRQDKLLEVDVRGQRHPRGVDAEDAALRLGVREGELDFPVDAARADEGRVQGLDLVGRHDDLDVAARVEAVHLVEELVFCCFCRLRGEGEGEEGR